MPEINRRVKLSKLVKDNDFEVIVGKCNLDKYIEVDQIDRPGIEFCGNFEFFDEKRALIIGVKETKLLMSYDKEKQSEIVKKLLSLKPPFIIFSGNEDVKKVLKLFKENADKCEVPLLKSDLKTTPLMGLLYYYLHDHLSPVLSEHGVLVDIYGIGTLIKGDSGIGKSETALELIRRGHILVSDDLVEIKEPTVGTLTGTAPKILRRYLEIRGIGIVDVVKMFGSASYRIRKRVQLVVELEKWDQKKEYDRLGINEEYVQFFNTKIAKITIPIQPGRSNATLVESAAMNYKLKKLGFNSAVEFSEEVAKRARGERDEDE